MGLNFTAFVGDDTGLIKKIKLMYNYQTDIVGSYMAKDDNFKDQEDEEADASQLAVKRQKQEAYQVSTKFDRDGQPLFKQIQRHIAGKQQAKYGKQLKNEGIV